MAIEDVSNYSGLSNSWRFDISVSSSLNGLDLIWRMWYTFAGASLMAFLGHSAEWHTMRLPIVGERVKAATDLWVDGAKPVPAGSIGTVVEVEEGVKDSHGLFGGRDQCRITVRFDEVLEQLSGHDNCYAWYPECGPMVVSGKEVDVLEGFWHECVGL